MKTVRIIRMDKIYEIKLMMEFPKETFIKGTTKETYMKVLRHKSTEAEFDEVIFTNNKLFQEKFGPHLNRGGLSIINLNLDVYYYLHFFCKKDVEKFIQEKLQKRNAFAKHMKEYGKRWNLNYDNPLPLFYPALTWYMEEAEEKFTPELITQIKKMKKILAMITAEDCFEQTRFWRLTNFYKRP